MKLRAQGTPSAAAACTCLKYGLNGLNEERLTEMLTFANAAASIITTREGALRVMPEADEVERFLSSAGRAFLRSAS